MSSGESRTVKQARSPAPSASWPQRLELRPKNWLRGVAMPSTNGCGQKRAILYTRVSGDEQKKRGYSLLDQRDALRAWASENGYEVVEEIEDAGYSGAYLERPGLDRVRALVRSGAADAVAVRCRDRIAR